MSELLVSPEKFRNRIENFGFEFLSFESRRLELGESFSGETAGTELAIVVLGGICSVKSSRGEWQRIGKRATVFDGLPFTLYLPINTKFTVTADSDCDLAFCYSRAEDEYPRAPGNAGRGGHRDPWRRQCHAPDQQHVAAEFSRASPDHRRGLHASGQLVQLSAAQARCAQPSRRS